MEYEHRRYYHAFRALIFDSDDRNNVLFTSHCVNCRNGFLGASINLYQIKRDATIRY